MTRISTAGAATALTVLMSVGGAATAQAAPADAPSVTVDVRSGDLSHEVAQQGPFRNVSSSVVYNRDSNRLTTTLGVSPVFVYVAMRGTATTSVLSESGEPLWTVTHTGATPCGGGTWIGALNPCKPFLETLEHTPPASVADRVQQQAARVVTTVVD